MYVLQRRLGEKGKKQKIEGSHQCRYIYLHKAFPLVRRCPALLGGVRTVNSQIDRRKGRRARK